MEKLFGQLNNPKILIGTINYGNRGPAGPQGPEGPMGPQGPSGEEKPYVSLERLGEYLFKITFDEIPEYTPVNNFSAGACSSFVRDGKLYRNYD